LKERYMARWYEWYNDTTGDGQHYVYGTTVWCNREHGCWDAKAVIVKERNSEVYDIYKEGVRYRNKEITWPVDRIAPVATCPTLDAAKITLLMMCGDQS
jgi:hypothetical protein